MHASQLIHQPWCPRLAARQWDRSWMKHHTMYNGKSDHTVWFILLAYYLLAPNIPTGSDKIYVFSLTTTLCCAISSISLTVPLFFLGWLTDLERPCIGEIALVQNIYVVPYSNITISSRQYPVKLIILYGTNNREAVRCHLASYYY